MVSPLESSFKSSLESIAISTPSASTTSVDRSEYFPVTEDDETTLCSSYYLPKHNPPSTKRSASDLTSLLSMNDSSMGNVSQYTTRNFKDPRVYNLRSSCVNSNLSTSNVSNVSLSARSLVKKAARNGTDNRSSSESEWLISARQPSYGTSEPLKKPHTLSDTKPKPESKTLLELETVVDPEVIRLPTESSRMAESPSPSPVIVNTNDTNVPAFLGTLILGPYNGLVSQITEWLSDLEEIDSAVVATSAEGVRNEKSQLIV